MLPNAVAGNCIFFVAFLFASCRGLTTRSGRAAIASGLAGPKGKVSAKPAWFGFCGASQS